MVLGIDTSAAPVGVALAHRGESIASLTIARGGSADEMLALSIERLMELARTGFPELDAVAVAGGPGSFTGLRIGMAAAKGIAFARGIPLVLVPTFDAIAWRIARSGLLEADTGVLAMMDARRGALYAAEFRIGAGTWRRSRGPEVEEMAALGEKTPQGTLICGDGAALLRESFPEKFRIISPAVSGCSAESVAGLGEEMLARGETADAATSEPLYLRDFQTTRQKSNLPSNTSTPQ